MTIEETISIVKDGKYILYYLVLIITQIRSKDGLEDELSPKETK